MNLPLLLLLFAATLAAASPKGARQEFDYNFDGHLDYRVLAVSNENCSLFDVFIFDAETSKHVKNETLSGTIYPRPDPRTKMVNCISSGGHSGALFTGHVYRWTGKDFEFAYTVRQEYLSAGDQSCYIRVKVRMEDGKPRIFSIEPGDPDWDDKGMSLE